MTMRTTFFSRTIIFLALLFGLTACELSPQQANVQPDQPIVTANDIEDLLSAAQRSESPIREQKQLQASQLLMNEQQFELAQQVIESIDTSYLSNSALAQYYYLQSQLYLHVGNYQSALNLLENQRLTTIMDSLPIQQQLSLTELKAQVMARLGSHIASAQQRIYIAPLLPADRQLENQQGIWRSLMMLDSEELSQYLPTAISQDYLAWLQLALIAKQNQQDLDKQLLQLELWQQQWPDHPATNQLPGELALIKQLASERPKHVALLLPLTGKLAPYGKAIRDGFLSSYFEAKTQGAEVPKLTVFDTATHSDFLALYNQAVTGGAELIIGPLDKGRLRQLINQPSLPVTTLALNRMDNATLLPDQLFQFGLSPQDEARQVAEIARLDQQKTAIVISPSGSWGDNVNRAFTDRWQQLGGDVIAVNSYSGQQDYSPVIKEALLLNDSEQRAKRMKSLISEPLEFFPRRREDVDMIFLLARPQQARSIMPLLAFHYAGDIPVYGTSRVYTGITNPQKDRDIEGIRFTDMPWVLNKPGKLRSLIDQELNSSQFQSRMVALGIDSFQLYPRLPQLQVLPESRVFGQTGTLSLNSQQQIERSTLFAEIKRGKARIIPVADTTELNRKESDNAFQKTPVFRFN